MTLSGATTPSVPGSNGNEEVLRIPQSPSTVLSPSDVLEVLPLSGDAVRASTDPVYRANVLFVKVNFIMFETISHHCSE